MRTKISLSSEVMRIQKKRLVHGYKIRSTTHMRKLNQMRKDKVQPQASYKSIFWRQVEGHILNFKTMLINFLMKFQRIACK